ncbi:MAG TPA: M3 family metallopeptidase [Methanospirillum sp.]|nr:M3 family metallopeptidase [Methanospirillum sp.]
MANPNPLEPIRSHYEPGEITALLNAAITTADASMDTIAKIPPGERTLNNTLLRFEDTFAVFYDAIYPLTIMGYVYPDEKVAAEGMYAEEQAAIFSIKTYSRRDLFDAIRSRTPVTPEESRLLNLTVREFTRNGLSLPDDELMQVRDLREKITKLESEFVGNLNNDNTTVEYTPDELTGLPPKILSLFQRTVNGTYLVTTKYPDYYGVMQNADRSDTRKRMLAAFVNRQTDKNMALLEEAITLRKQVAKILGYQSWVEYRTDGRMAKNQEHVISFLQDLKAPLREETRREMANLLIMKQLLNPGASSLDAWDLLYLTEQVKRQSYALDTEEIRMYFPARTVIAGMFDIFSDLLGVRFVQVPDAQVWDINVSLYQVLDTTDNTIIAYIYMDLFPRSGKYGHTMMCPLKNGRLLQDGTYSTPISVIVGNMRGPDGDIPSLLSFDDVQGLFHEFGHILHHSLTVAPYASLSGTNVEWDFVETPSQMVEEMVYEPVILDAISGHYLNQTQKIPPDMRENLITSKSVDIGLTHTNRYIKSVVDVASYSGTNPVDLTHLYNQEYTEMMGISPLPGSQEVATIDHYMAGYDAGYYSYLWSKVYALDVLKQVKDEGIQNGTTGERLKLWILGPGNTQDGMDLLKGFLGKEPGLDALYIYLHQIPEPSGGS